MWVFNTAISFITDFENCISASTIVVEDKANPDSLDFECGVQT